MKSLKTLLVAVALVFCGTALTACWGEKEKTAGEHLDDAIESGSDAMDGAMSKFK